MTRLDIRVRVSSFMVLVAVCIAVPAFAQSVGRGADPQSAQELSKKLVNPLTDMVSVPLQFNFINGVGPDDELQNLTYFQPVVPMSISKNWNLIGRWCLPYLSQPAAYGGSSGVSDIIAQAFLSRTSTNGFTWGAGPMFYLPATNDQTLGYGKWSVGPVAAVMKQKGSMTYGMLWNNVWSIADAGSGTPRPDVNMGYFQPVIAHSSRNGVTVVLSTETIANWKAEEDERWTVPVNVAVGKLTRFGMFPMNIQLGAGYYVVKPTDGPDWQMRTTFTLILPRGN